MREILFRGKRSDNGEWVLSHNIMVFKDGECQRTFMAGETENPIQVNVSPNGNLGLLNALECGLPLIDPSTIGQYTGLIDKNGKKIFEGDIVKTSHGGSTYYAKIEWDDGSFWVTNHDIQMPSYISEVSKTYLEVIGNIYDNPELLDNSELLEDRR